MAAICIEFGKTVDGKEEKKEIMFRIPSIKKAATGAFIYSVALRGLDKIRPPKRNIGALLNLYLAGVLTKAALDKIFVKKEETKEAVVSEEEEKSEGFKFDVKFADEEDESQETKEE